MPSLALKLGIKEGAGAQRFPFGQWNREQPHVCEVEYVIDDDGKTYIGAWARCSFCNDFGELYPIEKACLAEAEAEAHERQVWERKRAGERVLGAVF